MICSKSISQPNLALRVSLFGVGVKRRVEIDEIDAGIGKLFRVRQPAEVIAEIEPVRHLLDCAQPALHRQRARQVMINRGQLTLSPFIACLLRSCKSRRNLPPSPTCLLPRSRSNRAQKISSQPCDGSIKAEHGTLSMISSIAPAARL